MLYGLLQLTEEGPGVLGVASSGQVFETVEVQQQPAGASVELQQPPDHRRQLQGAGLEVVAELGRLCRLVGRRDVGFQ